MSRANATPTVASMIMPNASFLYDPAEGACHEALPGSPKFCLGNVNRCSCVLTKRRMTHIVRRPPVQHHMILNAVAMILAKKTLRVPLESIAA